MTVVIIVTNMGDHAVHLHGRRACRHSTTTCTAPAPVWNSTFWTCSAVELASLLITLSLPYFVAARRRDFI